MPRHRSGRILFCSTGILLRRLQTCPELNGISHLIIDEVHERDVLTDFLLVIIKDLLKKNVNLKVILMSASMNADLFSRYFDNAPLIHVNGRAFPVKEHFLADVLDFLPRGKQQQMNVKPIIDVDLVTRLICFIDKAKPVDGAILCFLPGWKDIKTIHSKLKVSLSLLHHSLSISFYSLLFKFIFRILTLLISQNCWILMLNVWWWTSRVKNKLFELEERPV